MHAISAQVIANISLFHSQNLTNTAWAYATLGLVDEPLMDAIAAASINRINSFIPMELTNLAWA